jgi:hypothetical protein
MLITGAGAELASAGGLHPGAMFYPAQLLAERYKTAALINTSEKAQYLITLVNRRVDELSAVLGTKYESQSLASLSQSIDQAAAIAAALPQKDAPAFRLGLLDVLDKVQIILSKVNSTTPQDTEMLDTLIYKTSTLRAMLKNSTLDLSVLDQQARPAAERTNNQVVLPATKIAPETATPPITPEPVYFPPGSAGALHAFYPLIGQHATLDCQACHSTGVYTGTVSLCADCHSNKVPANHFAGDCALCHTPTSWQDIHFDHAAAGAVDCISCHLDKKPANHYNGQCSACHTTTAWLPASFNHAVAGAVDCISCHLDKKPANHYNGQCSACHTTTAWLPASFNHAVAGAVDCISCHLDKKPANHFNGQCSACHTTTAWLPASFNHAAAGATDCISCHLNKKPANHFNGQCSACHNTSAWLPASFNHAAAGATDCQSCHTRPASHFPGQCSQCHDTTSWAGATFNHPFPINHGGAGGVCAKCHPGGTSSYTCYACHNKAEMEQKHAEKNILNIASRCANCHATGGGN